MDEARVEQAGAGKSGHLWEVVGLFLRLGFTAFGGPAAHLALIEDEVVKRRKWIDRQQFMDMVAAVNFIPGPNSTELVIHLGHVRAGWKGLVAAGVCFITPAMLIILPLGWLYGRFGQVPDVGGPLGGIRACVIAIVAAAMWRFAQAGVRDRFTLVLAVLAGVAGFLAQVPRFRLPQAELILLAAGALAGMLWYGRTSPGSGTKQGRAMPMIVPGVLGASGSAGGMLLGGKLLAMALFFLKVGATLFGSGYVLVSYLRGGLVEDYGWLNGKELTDAVAVGQITPGPLLTTATFIGYVLGSRWGGQWVGILGGVLATAAIFLPSFCFVAVLSPMWSRLRGSSLARGALNGMNAAVVALILVVAVGLAREAIHTPAAGAIAAASLGALLAWNVSSTWLILAAGLAGWGLGRAGMM